MAPPDAAALLAALEEAVAREPRLGADFALRFAALAKVVSQRSKADSGAAAASQAIGAERYVVKDMPFVSPRGKFDLVMGTTGFAVRGKDGTSKVEGKWADVSRLVVAPPAESGSDAGAAALVVVLSPRAPGGATPKAAADEYKRLALVNLQQCGGASAPAAGLRAAFPDVLAGAAGDSLAALMPVLFARLAEPTLAPEPLLRGAAGAGRSYVESASGAPFLKASFGASQGQLFVTQRGLFFQKPHIYLPCACIASIESGGGGGRFFDLDVEMEVPEQAGGAKAKAPTFQFSGIAREELERVQGFLRDVLLPARAKALRALAGAGAKEEPGGAEAAAAAESDDDSDADDDFDPDARAAAAASGESGSGGSDSDSDSDDSDASGDDSSDDFASDDGLKPGGLAGSETDEPSDQKLPVKRQRTANAD